MVSKLSTLSHRGQQNYEMEAKRKKEPSELENKLITANCH